MLLQGYPWVPSKNVSPFGPSVWPAIAIIYISEELYYIEYYLYPFGVQDILLKILLYIFISLDERGLFLVLSV